MSFFNAIKSKRKESNMADNTDLGETQNDIKEDENELVAVLTAAIMSYYGTAKNCNLRITSYKRAENRAPAWNNAGRRENIDAAL